MTIVNIHDAKTNLSRLIQKAENGEEVIIARAGKPVVRLEAIVSRPAKRVAGGDEGRINIAPDFNDPLAEFETL